MNFLAHLHLSGESPGYILGGILGDFVRGRLPPGRFPEPVRQGIILHRRIDALTDAHPIWRSSKALLPPHQKRYAGIIIDVIYDHYLAKHWPRFSEIPFSPWVSAIYRILKSEIADLLTRPSDSSSNLDEASEVITAIAEDDWLRSYLDPDEIPKILSRISHRSPRLAPMENSGESFEVHYPVFESHFLDFYPDLITQAMP